MVDFEDYEMRRGTAIWVRPGQVQRWSDIDDGFDADVAVFESSAVPDLPLFDRLIETAITQLDHDTDRLEQQMRWMADDLESNHDPATAAAVVGVILRLFARHAHNDEDNTPGRQLTTAFIGSIERNIGQRSVTWHARQIGASTRSIARATAETFGQQPKDIIDAHVILEAQRRLAWSSDDISTIARALDFSEASNFTKFFRTRTGRAPSTFRATVTSI
jgi:AraC-like DNA-binding protein